MKSIKLQRIIYFGSVALLLYLPFHIFLSQSLSLVTGGLNYWKVAKDIALYFLGLLSLICMAINYGLFWQKRWLRIFIVLSFMYLLVHVVTGVLNSNDTQSTLLGIIYNLRFIAAFVIGVCAFSGPETKRRVSLIKVIVWISGVVAALGVIQYFLPKDILSHVGYSLARGVKPNFFIDDKPDLPRVMSVMRDPNTLGAFLMLPAMLILNKLSKYKNNRRLWLVITVIVVCLLLTFSRSALLGLIIASGLYYGYEKRSKALRLGRRYMYLLVAVVVVSAGLLFVWRNSYFVQNTLLHADRSTRQRDSNELRIDYTKKVVSKIIHRPFGYGPGSAGLVSIHQSSGGQLTENYYLQIAYEVGVIGLVMFLAFQLVVLQQIYRHRREPLARVLLAAYLGLGFMNLLLHIWSSEAVVYYWWFLAGYFLAVKAKE